MRAWAQGTLLAKELQRSVGREVRVCFCFFSGPIFACFGKVGDGPKFVGEESWDHVLSVTI